MCHMKILLFFVATYAASVENSPIPIVDSLEYLVRYGYVVKPDPRRGTLLDEKDVNKALKLLQRMAGLVETGQLDEETLKIMNQDRCGMPDFSPTDNARRRRRYKKFGTRWNKGNLTWWLGNSNNDKIHDDKVREVMRKAFKKWSDITNLDFKEEKAKPDIQVRFEQGQHKDIFAFDGPGGVLAHAFYPSPDPSDDLAGDVHFDDAEVYTVDSPSGRSLLWVAVHELGHSIGLDHSGKKGAVMYPWYQSNGGKDFDLTLDDVKGAQSIYGIRSQNKTDFKPVSGKPTKPRFCLNKVQSGYTAKDGRTYVINGAKAYIFDRFLVPEKGPIHTPKLFQGLSRVDALFERQWDAKTVVFSGKRYYVYKDNIKVSSGSISDGFLGLPKDFSDVKTAFVWPGNGRLYLFRDNQYWRFSGYPITGMYKVDLGYPRLTRKAWKGVPKGFDSVFSWRNGKTYFFKGNKYYRLNDRKLSVEFGYPRVVSEDWSKCVGALKAPDNGAAGQGGNYIPRIVTVILLTVFLIRA